MLMALYVIILALLHINNACDTFNDTLSGVNEVIDISKYQHHGRKMTFERRFQSKKSLCNHIDFYYWKDVELNCKNIPEIAISDYNTYVNDFKYFQNIRLLPQYMVQRNTSGNSNNQTKTSVFIAFDIIANSGTNAVNKGNWYTVYAKKCEQGNKRDISIVGRTIDHWNGNYSVYLQLPHPGLYEVEIVLDYLACRGFPSGVRPTHTQGGNTQYIGHLAYKARIKAIPKLFKHISSHSLSKKRDYQLKINTLLADLGYFENRIYTPPKESCLPQLALPQNHSDSTNGQIYRCLNLTLEWCVKTATNDCNAVEYLLATCQAAYAGNSSFAQPRNLKAWKRMISFMTEFQGLMRDPLPIDALNRLFALQEFKPDNIVVLMNTGLHPLVSLNWDQQKVYYDTFYNYIKARESASKKWFVWRDIWSVHEYAYMQNPWKGNNGNEPWYKAGVITEMTDAGAYLQRSYTLNRFFNEDNSTLFQYLPSYFMTKSHIKAKGDIFAHDMRHHEIYTILEIVKQLVDSVTL